MERIKSKLGYIKFYNAIEELNANRYFLLQKLLIFKNATQIKTNISRIAHFLNKGMIQYASEELILLNQSIYLSENDVSLEFALLAVLQATKEPLSISQAIEQEKFLRSLEIDADKVKALTEGLKKKLMLS